MIKKILTKYKELIMYVLFGALTTVVNFVCFYILDKLGVHYLINNTISWIAAVIFAYITNKLFVFESKSWKPNVFFKEVLEFFMARLFSYGVEQGGLLLFVEVFKMKNISFDFMAINITGTFIAKIILSVVVIILNYIFSKFIIFAKKSKN